MRLDIEYAMSHSVSGPGLGNRRGSAERNNQDCRCQLSTEGLMDDRDDLVWADACPGQALALSETFSLTLGRQVGEAESLRRIGGRPDTIATRALAEIADLRECDDGCPAVASVPAGHVDRRVRA